MNLSDIVTSLALSKKLCAFGIKQESFFYWIIDVIGTRYDIKTGNELNNFCSAFTASELFEILPWSLLIDFNPCQLLFTGGKPYILEYRHIGNINKGLIPKIFPQHDTNAADCAAKMLIYLIENKLIEV